MISFNTQATSNKTKNPFGDTSSGLIGNINKATGMTQPVSTSQPIQQGTNPGIIPATPKPTTPVKKVTQPDGTTVEYHKETVPTAPKETTTPKLTSDTPTPKLPTYEQGKLTTENPTPEVTPPASLTTAGQAPGVLGSGTPTNYEKTTIGGLINQSQTESPQVTKARQDLADFQRNLAETDKAIAGQGISLSSSRGQQANIGQAAAAELAALQGAVTNALTSQGQQITAGTAANTGAQTQAQRNLSAGTSVLGAVQPQFPGYNQQIIQPGLLGNTNMGTNGTAISQLPQQAQTAIQSYAQQVQSGSMTRGDAESRLSAYGIAGINALNEALGTGFNTNASNASAGTTATGQQVSTFANSANAALDKLSSDFIDLPDWQKMGIPGTIGIEQALGKFFGNDKLSTYQTTLHDARAQVSGVLATAGGMTPTSAGDTANAYLPDNMTKDQLAAKIAAVKTLIEQKVQAFQQSGAQDTSGGTTGGTTSAGGYDFVQDANGNWKPK